jgi:hypothetical protein
MKRMLFVVPEGYEGYKDYYNQIGLREAESVLVLGEIENMPGHLAVVNRDGIVRWGLHPEMFEEE